MNTLSQVRVLPPPNVQKQTISNGTQTFNATPGSTRDVRVSDANLLQGNGWIGGYPLPWFSGPTTNRPTDPTLAAGEANYLGAGTLYLDTTVGALIVYDGANWRNPATGASV